MPYPASGGHRDPASRYMAAVACLVFGGCVASTSRAHAQDGRVVVFDPAFLTGDGLSAADLQRFSRGNPVLPGSYDVDIWMNGEWQARRPIRFEAHSGGTDATPCVAYDDLVSFGLAPDRTHPRIDDPCLEIGQRIGAATARLDVGEQRLDIEVPQAAMARRRPGAVPPGQWDSGVTAGLLAWRMSVRDISTVGRRHTSGFFGADAGVNLGAWRLRHAGAWSSGRYRRRHGFVERHVGSLGSHIRIGDISLAGDLFTPVRLRGISMASDARMTADASSGYRPPVKGVAATHATVRVTQNGVLLRELTVPPGPFSIDDLHGAGQGGDLEVNVEESDGHRWSFRVPFFPVPELMREGHTGYAVSAGRALVGRRYARDMIQATWRHGFPRRVTVYAGASMWPRHASALVGAATDTLVGAFATDLTHSSSRGGGNARLWRVRHGKRWNDRTLLSFGASRGHDAPPPGSRRARTRAMAVRRVDAAVQRDLGHERGALSISASYSSYGRQDGSTSDQAVSWTRSWRRATMDLSLRRSVRRGMTGRRSEMSGQFGISLPLGVAATSLNLHATVLGGRAGGARIGITGSSGEGGATLYGATLGYGRRGARRADVSLVRLLPVGEIAAAVDRTESTHAASLSAAGGVVIHAGGISFSQRLGEAVALVRAPGATGARIGAGHGTRIDRRGHAIVPYLTPFRWNSVDLDPTGLPMDVSVVSTHRRVAPTPGAVVLVPFDTDVARTWLVTASFADGAPLPFGADVIDAMGRSVGVIGQMGRMFLRTPDAASHWAVRWEGATGECILRLRNTTKTAAGDARYLGVCE
ncbi:fimbria/pilus outer membrane usher protein [Luteibacter yeojuensis]